MIGRSLCVFLLGVSAMSLTASVRADDETPLWQLKPFDRIELSDDTVHEIDPVRIPADIVFRAAAERAVVETGPRDEKQIVVKENEYVGIPGLPSPDKLRGEIRGGLFKIRRQADGLDYYVAGRSIRRMHFYEDLLLQEANERIRSRHFEEAFPFIETVSARDPQWPGLLAARLRLHLGEADQFGVRNRWTQAFESLASTLELAEQADSGQLFDEARPDSIRNKLDRLAKQWVDAALALEDFEQGRRVVARLETLHPESSVAADVRQEYGRRADRLLASMTRQVQSGDYIEALQMLDQARLIAPDLPAVRRQAEEFYQTHPALRVAVANLARFDRGPADWTADDRRCVELVHLALLQLTGDDDSQPFESPIIQSLEQSNVNKRVTVTLRDSVRWPSDDKAVTSMDVLRLLVHHCRPESPMYHPGLARLVTGLQPEYPAALHIDFERPQFRPAAWLQINLIRVAGSDNRSRFSTSEGLGPFQLTNAATNRNVFMANPTYFQTGQPVLQQIVEQRYASSAEQLRALEKRHADMMAYVPPRLIEKAEALPGVRVIRQSLPTVHVLQFDFEKPVFQDRTFRRAIDYAINRESILKKIGVTPNDEDRIITAPLPADSYGYNDQVTPREANPLLAKAVLMGLRKKLGGIPRLTLAHSGNETSTAACREIARALGEVGVEVRLIDRRDDRHRNVSADMSYESYVVKEPLFHLITLFTRENPSLMPHATPWLRQQLVELQNVPHYTAAQSLLPSLHRTLHEDAAMLPLWQWHDHFAVTDAVENLPEEPRSPYDGVSQCTVVPSYPPAYWETK